MKPLQQLSPDQLQQLGTHSLHQIAKSALGTLTTFRLILGRCLLAMSRGEHYLEFGCSSALHYATSQLGMDVRQARECRRMARLLESLPRLTVAAEEGWLCWSKLREVVRVATPEDEQQWLEVCARCNYAEVERIVAGRAQAKGVDSVASELRLQLDPEARQMLEQVFRLISQEAGTALPPAQALELLCADYLSRKSGLDLEDVRGEVRKDLQAAEERECPARDIWEAATACQSEGCPDNERVELVRPAPAHWRNPKLAFNPQARGVTKAQRAELVRRDGYRCQTPGCPHHLFLEVHHVKFYSEFGATVPENLVCLCSKCHRNVHAGHLKVVGEAPQQLQFLDRYGRDLRQQSELELASWLDTYVGWTGGEWHSRQAQLMMSA